jgi:hypothetical protein
VLGLLKRHEVQVLLRAGHSQAEVSRLTGVSPSEIRRIEAEGPVEHLDDAAERRRRGIGRPSKAEPLSGFVLERLARDPNQTSLALLEGARQAGYSGNKSAFYAMVARLRPQLTRAIGRVGEMPGDVSEHGFGEAEVRFAGNGLKRVAFFVSQLVYSRWSEVSIVPDRGMESLLRTLAEHYERMGGVPLVAVFDRHNASAIVSNVDGAPGPWHPGFAQALLDLGIGVDLRGRGPHQRSGAPVERLVRWVKGAFFRGRRFVDDGDMRARLAEWTSNVDTGVAARGTGAIPESRMSEERVRLRAMPIRAADFSMRIPVVVGARGEIGYEGISYWLPERTAGQRAVIHVRPDVIRVVGVGFDIEHPRRHPSSPPEFPE